MAGKTLWISEAKKRVRTLWEGVYKGKHAAPAMRESSPQELSAYIHLLATQRDPNPFEAFLYPPDFYATATHSRAFDEYKKYLEIPHMQCETPLEWWKGRNMEWPSLTAMALDHLSTPLMSSECERVFSSAGYLITARRNHMKEDTIEAMTCLRGWQVYL
jgi:hypothetical protein